MVEGLERAGMKWERSKRQKVASLAENETILLALAAAAKSAKESPTKQGMGFVIKKATEDAAKVKKSIGNKEPVKMSDEEALALKVHCDLSDDQYQMISNSSLVHNANIYPNLHRILEAKASCYPLNINISETTAVVPLQDMLNHTLSRILELSGDQLGQEEQGKEGVLYLKIGFDGASSQSIYNKDLMKQIFKEEYRMNNLYSRQQLPSSN